MKSRSDLRKTLDTAARHIQKHGLSSETDCRWCGRTLNLAGFCPNGCAKEAVNVGDCQECGEPFTTGRPKPVLCDRCERRDANAHVDGYRGAGFRQRQDVYAQGFRNRERER